MLSTGQHYLAHPPVAIFTDTSFLQSLLHLGLSRVSWHLNTGDAGGGTALLAPLIFPGGSSPCPPVLMIMQSLCHFLLILLMPSSWDLAQ